MAELTRIRKPIVSGIKGQTLSNHVACVAFAGGGLCGTEDGAKLLGAGETAVDEAVVYADGAILEATDGVRTIVSVPLAKPTGGSITSISLPDAPLAGYVAAPMVQIEGDGVGAYAVAEYDSTNETVTGVTLVCPGHGYTQATAALYFGSGTDRVPLDVTVGAAAESGGLVKRGAGTVVLNAANGYTGSTTVEEGSLEFAAAGSLPAGSAVILRGGTAVFADASEAPAELEAELGELDPERKYVLASYPNGRPATLPTVKVNGSMSYPNGYRLCFKGNNLVFGYAHGVVLIVR